MIGGRSDLDNHKNVSVQMYYSLYRCLCLIGQVELSVEKVKTSTGYKSWTLQVPSKGSQL